MLSKKSIFLFVLIFLRYFAVYGQSSIILGDVTGKWGEVVQVPISLSSNTDCVALLLRLEYDAERLVPGAARQGTLMTAFHSIDSHSPEEGRVNVIVYAHQQYEAFTSREGTVALLDFTIKPESNPGITEIFVTAAGAPDLSVSELVDNKGNVVIPQVSSGTVNIQTGTMATTWTLY